MIEGWRGRGDEADGGWRVVVLRAVERETTCL